MDMKNEFKAPLRVATFAAVLAATVIGCDSSGGPGSNIPRGDDSSSGNGLSQTNIPASLTSAFDSSQTLRAIQRGVDVNSTLLDDNFSCYSDNAVGWARASVAIKAMEPLITARILDLSFSAAPLIVTTLYICA